MEDPVEEKRMPCTQDCILWPVRTLGPGAPARGKCQAGLVSQGSPAGKVAGGGAAKETSEEPLSPGQQASRLARL